MLQKLRKEDINIIHPFLIKYPYHSANYNLITIYLWSIEFPTFYYIEDDVLYLFEEEGEELVALLPVTDKKHLTKSLKRLEEIFQILQKPFIVRWVPKALLADLDLKQYQIDAMDDLKEYIYLGEKIRTLSGKKMQKKRNNYNYFIKNYNYSSRLLGRSDFKDVLALLDEWIHNEEELGPYVVGEIKGITYLLEIYEELKYQIYGVFIDNELKGFSICSMLDEQVVEINIEKADKNIRGLYTFLTVQFQRDIYPNAKYINREDDAGDLQLRRSKQSFYPDLYFEVCEIRKA